MKTLAALAAALVGVVALAPGPAPAFQPSTIDRRMVVESLQVLSDHVGFGGRFALGADGVTLVAKNLDLCAEDFVDELPMQWARDIRETGFERFACDGGGIELNVRLFHLEVMR